MSVQTSELTGTEVLRGVLYKHIVVFPYSSNFKLGADGEAEPYLSVLSKIAIDAAIGAMLSHDDAVLAIPGETPVAGRTGTTELMSDRAVAAGVKESSIIGLRSLKDGRYLNNTYLQAHALREHFQDDTDDLLVITLEYHAKRVLGALSAFDAKPRYMSRAEDILHASGITKYDPYFELTYHERRSEFAAWLMTNAVGLPKGQIPNVFTRIKGARIADIEHTDSGLVFVNGFANKKLAGLRRESHLVMTNAQH